MERSRLLASNQFLFSIKTINQTIYWFKHWVISNILKSSDLLSYKAYSILIAHFSQVREKLLVHPNWMRHKALKYRTAETQYARPSCSTVPAARWTPFWYLYLLNLSLPVLLSLFSFSHVLSLFPSLTLSVFAGLDGWRAWKNKPRQRTWPSQVPDHLPGQGLLYSRQWPSEPWQQGFVLLEYWSSVIYVILLGKT